MSSHDIRLLDRHSAASPPAPRSRAAAAQARRTVRSAAIACLTIAVLGIIVTVGVMLLTAVDTQWNPSLTLASIGIVFMLIGLAGAPVLRGIAVSRMQRLRPDTLVFLGLREVTNLPHLRTFQYRKDNTENIPDSWVMAVVDERGISVWSTGIRPKELILIQWSELGDVRAVSFSSLTGRRRIGASLDVRPIPHPLLVSLGYAAMGVEGSVDREGVFAMVDAINSLRPT